MMRRLVLTVLLGLGYAATAAPKSADVSFGGFTLGEDFKAVRAKLKKKRRTLYVPQNFVDQQSGAKGAKYRCDKSLAADSGIRNSMLYFSAHAELYGYDVFVKGKTTFSRYRLQLKNGGFQEQDRNTYVGVLQAGPYAGAKVTVSLSTLKGRRRAYVVEVRCREILLAAKTAATPAARGRDEIRIDTGRPAAPRQGTGDGAEDALHRVL